MQRDSTRTRIWFPLFSFFESSIEGIVPNEYESVAEICENLCACGKQLYVKLLSIKPLMAAKMQILNLKSPSNRNGRRQSHKRSKKSKNS